MQKLTAKSCEEWHEGSVWGLTVGRCSFYWIDCFTLQRICLHGQDISPSRTDSCHSEGEEPPSVGELLCSRLMTMMKKYLKWALRPRLVVKIAAMMTVREHQMQWPCLGLSFRFKEVVEAVVGAVAMLPQSVRQRLARLEDGADVCSIRWSANDLRSASVNFTSANHSLIVESIICFNMETNSKILKFESKTKNCWNSG